MQQNARKGVLLLRFDVTDNNIQTTMKTENVTPQEAIGLLEMAKTQILDNLKEGKKDIFQAFKKDENETGKK
ncbi:hypothetical protein HYX01_04830 [Candidatus Woesearchaeota archaeon]|nr:hypothetical protein [Candidatus Woesearchaeota archaeon]